LGVRLSSLAVEATKIKKKKYVQQKKKVGFPGESSKNIEYK
jgi:hypothetical protein